MKTRKGRPKPNQITRRSSLSRPSISSLNPATDADVTLRVFSGHTGTIHRVALISNDTEVLTTGQDGTVRRWDLRDEGGTSEVVANGEPFFGLAVSRDGSRIAVSEGKSRILVLD